MFTHGYLIPLILVHGVQIPERCEFCPALGRQSAEERLSNYKWLGTYSVGYHNVKSAQEFDSGFDHSDAIILDSRILKTGEIFHKRIETIKQGCML